jgi:hypothetical protein
VENRNNIVDFLVFNKQNGTESVDVRVQDENVWLTIDAISKLYNKGRSTISGHIKAIFEIGELDEVSVRRDFRHTASDGKKYSTKHYNLDLVISVGYRVNSDEAIAFRKWATKIIKAYSVQGYVLDKERLKDGKIFNEEYFDHLLEEIQEIRASERLFYQKITDIYATAADYDPKSYITHNFFANVQNKLHFAIHQHTAAEVIMERANHERTHMGLTSWKNSPKGKILKSDVSVAKNYLSQLEMKDLDEIVSMYLDYAGRQARRKIPMTMKDWEQKLDAFLEFNDERVLKGHGNITHEIAKQFAENEYEKYRIKQDIEYISDFDQLLLDVKDEK